MTMARQELGKAGENTAAGELERRGYAVIERRYRTRHGEIDIVAEDGETLVFVEVKVRAGAERGTAAEAVTPRKQRKIAAMAQEYLSRHQLTGRRFRFDVVAIDGLGEAQRVVLYRGAFDASR